MKPSKSWPDTVARVAPIYLGSVVGLSLLLIPEPTGATKAAGLAILGGTYVVAKGKR
jgi:hypothetical protein